MHPGEIAAEEPNKPAYIMTGTGQVVTYSELEAGANQIAHLFRKLGLKLGDRIGIMLENHPRYLQICWAAQRAGLYYTPISWRLLDEEVAYMLNNSEAKVFICSHTVKNVAPSLLDNTPGVIARYMIDGVVDGYADFEEAIASMPTTPIADQCEGAMLLYSSGTTGYPKGIHRPLKFQEYGTAEVVPIMTDLYGATRDSIYLSPAPMYHSAPLGFAMLCLRMGCTVVIMEHFDPEQALASIEKYKITHSQWVPTMFVRMLKLPVETRSKYDLSSLKYAIHGAAPCPVLVKEQMIEWWGEILYEYYAGTEAIGFVHLNSAEWLAHRGSVGRPLNCELHICDDDGNEVPVGTSGTIYMGGGPTFEYYKDKKKTEETRHPAGWATLGDVGYLDEEGYLYLTDRKHFMIISGGVNIYPQETENVLIMHDKVMDVAVFGVPNDEFGEEVKAVVQLREHVEANSDLESELIEYCRAHLSHVKCPQTIDFRKELPRHPTGKLYKRLLKDEYWAAAGKNI